MDQSRTTKRIFKQLDEVIERLVRIEKKLAWSTIEGETELDFPGEAKPSEPPEKRKATKKAAD